MACFPGSQRAVKTHSEQPGPRGAAGLLSGPGGCWLSWRPSGTCVLGPLSAPVLTGGRVPHAVPLPAQPLLCSLLSGEPCGAHRLRPVHLLTIPSHCFSPRTSALQQVGPAGKTHSQLLVPKPLCPAALLAGLSRDVLRQEEGRLGKAAASRKEHPGWGRKPGNHLFVPKASWS